MTNAQATESLKAATTEYVNQYGIGQFISGQITAYELADMYNKVDELNGLEIEDAERIIQNKIDEFIASIEDEDQVLEFWENVSACAEYNDDLALATVGVYLSGKDLDVEFFTDNYVKKDEFGKPISLDTWRLVLSRAKRVDNNIPGFDAYEEEITIYGTTFQVITTCWPSGNELHIAQIN